MKYYFKGRKSSILEVEAYVLNMVSDEESRMCYSGILFDTPRVVHEVFTTSDGTKVHFLLGISYLMPELKAKRSSCMHVYVPKGRKLFSVQETAQLQLDSVTRFIASRRIVNHFRQVKVFDRSLDISVEVNLDPRVSPCHNCYHNEAVKVVDKCLGDCYFCGIHLLNRGGLMITNESIIEDYEESIQGLPIELKALTEAQFVERVKYFIVDDSRDVNNVVILNQKVNYRFLICGATEYAKGTR